MSGTNSATIPIPSVSVFNTTTGQIDQAWYRFFLALVARSGGPTSTAGGDLSGSYPNPSVVGIKGAPIVGATPTDANLLIANGIGWDSKPMSGDATIDQDGVVTITGGTVTVGNLKLFGNAGAVTGPGGNITIGTGLALTPTGAGPAGTLTAPGAPGGTSGQVQYNNAGAFGGFTTSGDATINTATGVLTLASTAVSPGSYTNTNLTVDAAGRITAAANGSAGSALGFNTQTGTTYTVVAADTNKLVTFSNAATVNVTLPQAGSAGFGSGFNFWAQNLGAGYVRITTSTSTFQPGGQTTLDLMPGMPASLLVSDGTNWWFVGTVFYARGASSTILGGWSLQVPDSTAVGGNARGYQAIDLQLSRASAGQVASGPYSFAAGKNNTTASVGIAIGDTNTASGASASTALGVSNTASGQYATAIGNTNTASSTGAVAIGTSNSASTNGGAVAIGTGNTTTGQGSPAIGRNNNVGSGTGSAGIGNSNTVGNVNAAQAFGDSNSVTGAYGTAVGRSNTVSGAGNGAWAIGAFNTASGDGSIVIAANRGYSLGVQSFVTGCWSTDHTNTAANVWSGTGGPDTSTSALGHAQREEYILWVKTAGSTAVRMTTDGAAVAAANVAAFRKGIIVGEIDVVCYNVTGGTGYTYTLDPLTAYCGATAGTFVIIGAPTFILAGTVGAPAVLQAIPSVVADTTRGGFDISVTPPLANTDTWYFVARLRFTLASNV